MKDSQFFNYFLGILGALIAFLIVIIVIANSLTDDTVTDKMVIESIEKNIEPVGQVATSDSAAASSSAGAAPAAFDAKATYQAKCFACHGTGAAGAPKLGDKAAWKARIAQGKSTLYKNAIGGKGSMPPKGGTSLPDDQFKLVVDYIVSKGK